MTFLRYPHRRSHMLSGILTSWFTLHRPAALGSLWMAVPLGALTFLDLRDGGILLIPPSAATLTVLVHQPNVSIAQPIAVVGGWSWCDDRRGT